MPPRPKFSKQMIIDTALDVVRLHGWSALSARRIAEQLESSVGPIYSFMGSMNDLEAELVGRVYELLHKSMITPRTGDPILDLALGYILFARDEKRLFRCFIEEKYLVQRRSHSKRLWRLFSGKFFDDDRYRGLSQKQIEEHRKKLMVFVYGLAVFINTGFPADVPDDEDIAAILRETGDMLLSGLRSRINKNKRSD